MPDGWDPSSAVLALIGELDAAGLTVGVTPEGRLLVSPKDRLTPGLRETVRQHLAELRLCAMFADEGVLERRAAFDGQLRDVQADVMVPTLMFRPETVFRRGHCLSCDATISNIGQCWRCRFAARAALGLPIQLEFEGDENAAARGAA